MECKLWGWPAPACPASPSPRRGRWFGGIKYVIGGKEWSADELEHGVLRGNSPSPASLLALLGRPQWARPTFREGDARARLVSRHLSVEVHASVVMPHVARVRISGMLLLRGAGSGVADAASLGTGPSKHLKFTLLTKQA